LKRLRLKIALEIRQPAIVPQPADLDLSPKSPDYLPTLARVLDVLAEANFSVRDAAARIAISTAKLSAYLSSDEKLWTFVNSNREKLGLKKLISS